MKYKKAPRERGFFLLHAFCGKCCRRASRLIFECCIKLRISGAKLRDYCSRFR
jgi:hypothetical protein